MKSNLPEVIWCNVRKVIVGEVQNSDIYRYCPQTCKKYNFSDPLIVSIN